MKIKIKSKNMNGIIWKKERSEIIVYAPTKHIYLKK